MSNMKYFDRSMSRAFTIIEVLVVITVISVLTGATMLSTTKYQQNARDSERQSKSTIIASALEKYYEENNEYPRCALITDTPANVKSTTLKGLANVDSLKAPRAVSGSNSVVCGTTVPASPQDAFLYTCTSNIACAKWELKYRKESDGAIVSIPSQRTGEAGANGGVTLAKPTVSLTASLPGADAIASASATCSTGTPEYQIHFYRNSGTFPGTWTDASSATVTAIQQGESATFEAQARCVQPGFDPSDYEQSAVAAVNRPIIAPTGLATTATLSGSNAVGTLSGGSCSGGTVLKRQIRSMTEYAPYTGAWTGFADIAGTTQTLPLNEGWAYYFSQQAQCYNATSGVGSSWTADPHAYVVRPFATLGAPSVNASGNLSNINFSWNGGAACPFGTGKQYQWYRTGSWGGSFGWWGPIEETTHDWPDNSQGYTFSIQVQQRCSSGYTNGAWSASGSASYARGVSTPGAPSGFNPDRQGYGGLAFSWNAPACGQGTQGEWRADFANQGGGGILWVNPPSGHQNYWWYGGNAYADSYASPGTPITNGWPSYGYVGDRNNQYAVTPPRMNLDVGTPGAFDTDNYFKIAVEYRCRNPTSGIASGFGPINSYSFRFP
jgi:prepilin-type N-terminal cleavage/methylation domain-containing protein